MEVFLINFSNKKSLLFAIILCTHGAQSMEKQGQNNPNALTSLSIRANYSEENKEYISNAVKNGLNNAKDFIDNLNKKWCFTPLMKKPNTKTGVMTLPEYHISLAVVEHAASTDTVKKLIGQKHITCLTDLWNKNIYDPNQYAGQSYDIHMYVHGYDQQAKEVHQHYSFPSLGYVHQQEDLLALEPQDMTEDLQNKFQAGVSSVHYVLAYEPNQYMPGQIQRPDIIVNVNKLMNDIAQKRNDKQCPMKDAYENKHLNFTAHTTIGVLKTVTGKVTDQSPRIQTNDYAKIINIFNLIFVGFDKQHIKNISFDSFSINGMKTDGKQKVVIGKLQ